MSLFRYKILFGSVYLFDMVIDGGCVFECACMCAGGTKGLLCLLNITLILICV